MFLIEIFSELESGCTQGLCRRSHKVSVSVVQCEKKVDSVKLSHWNSRIWWLRKYFQRFKSYREQTATHFGS